ncbi:MAG: DUF2283 domain-containing protein [Chloroflexi bacterium]|nr:DUF2283 domain-containing protein [Chloroflexota bacterium]
MEMRNVFSALPSLLAVSPHVWIDLDESADVLYISFRKPQQANDSVMENNIVYHYADKDLVGVTIIGVRALLGQTPTNRN